MTMTYGEAVQIAAAAHEGQTDKLGAPYIQHVLTVSLTLPDTLAPADRDLAQIVAVLHDTVEDTDLTVDDLVAAGLPDRGVQALERLTRTDGRPYEQFVRAVLGDPIAEAVKVADVTHNLSRVHLLDDERLRQRLRRKYGAALQILNAPRGVRGLIDQQREGLVEADLPPEQEAEQDRPDIQELIEASSLGTPAARALRDATPPEVVDRIMDRVRVLEGVGVHSREAELISSALIWYAYNRPASSERARRRRDRAIVLGHQIEQELRDLGLYEVDTTGAANTRAEEDLGLVSWRVEGIAEVESIEDDGQALILRVDEPPTTVDDDGPEDEEAAGVFVRLQSWDPDARLDQAAVTAVFARAVGDRSPDEPQPDLMPIRLAVLDGHDFLHQFANRRVRVNVEVVDDDR